MSRTRRAPKPPVVEPLRYRIDPSAKKLDQLDALEAELERTKGSYDPETYFDLLGNLADQRAAVIAKRDKGKPVSLDGESFSSYHVPWHTVMLCKWRARVTEGTFKWLIFLFVIGWLICRNKS